MFEITPTIKGEKVQLPKPPTKFFEAIGGMDGMKRFMYDFYDRIYESEIAHYFPQDEEEFEEVKKKNTLFFTQLCGGPKVYESDGMDLESYMVHFHDDFSIDDKARMEWLHVMRETLQDLDIDESQKATFWDYVEALSKLMVNVYPKEDKFVSAY